MSREPTKAELLAMLDDENRKREALAFRERELMDENRRLKGDTDRLEGNWKGSERRLSSIRDVVVAELKVRHNVGLNPEAQWVGSRDIEVEDSNEEIRLLRHIHELANNEPPF